MSLFEWLALAARLDPDGVELYPRFFASHRWITYGRLLDEKPVSAEAEALAER